MVLTQWYDIAEIIGAIFIGFVAMFALVVYLEQWLARPEPPSTAALAERQLAEPEDTGL